jgi:hypothetical protein
MTYLIKNTVLTRCLNKLAIGIVNHRKEEIKLMKFYNKRRKKSIEVSRTNECYPNRKNMVKTL